jgi:RNA polymerase sigma-70 factor (sigma-E family)
MVAKSSFGTNSPASRVNLFGVADVGPSVSAAFTIGSVAPVSASFDDAFDGLFRDAYRVAFRLLGSREDADDVAQEALARASVRWSRVVGGGDPAPWVVRVATNLALDRWRRGRTAAAYASSVGATANTVDRADDRVDLHRALAGLPKRQREVVVLRYVADLSEAAVADALGCSVGTVKTHASRGLAALRTALDVTDDEEA